MGGMLAAAEVLRSNKNHRSLVLLTHTETSFAEILENTAKMYQVLPKIGHMSELFSII